MIFSKSKLLAVTLLCAGLTDTYAQTKSNTQARNPDIPADFFNGERMLITDSIYVSFMWRDPDGNIDSGPLLESEPGAEYRYKDVLPAEFDPDLGWQVLGWVHNHPRAWGAPDEYNEVNLNPSYRDWWTFDALIEDGYATRNRLSIYIIGWDGQNYQFIDADRKDHTGHLPICPEFALQPRAGVVGDEFE